MTTFVNCIESVPLNVDISFSGYAEPWLNDNCTNMVESALAKGHGVKIFTTLVGMNPSDAERIMALPLKRIVIHLADDGSFMKVKMSKKYLEVLEIFLKAKHPKLSFMSIGRVNEEILKVLPQKQVGYHALISRAGNVNQDIIIPPAYLEGPIICSAERLYRNVLLPNGDVTLCCMDFGREHVIGNLLVNKYKDIHKTLEFRKVISLMAGEEGKLLCRNCEFAIPVT
ncbi:Iron-sulfur cluster-binding domain-containing protein [Pedobacter sp. ok626]|uniref:SPASM domain-containing protein n=1 Tax=Pedobacter sp. ok626 TaxID=1761882 RepID=UPI00088085C9|nr:SPASM domain-containing protein [Pedobacter sp. ok626]SDJ48596.1 Iron-sulfur cluster-binding domain-containing protein [Pedobacter sp. ok626]